MNTKSQRSLRLEPSVRVRKRTHSRALDGITWGLTEDILVSPSEVDPWVNNQLAQDQRTFVTVAQVDKRTTWSVPEGWAAS